uniref:Uncharacterized protein n=1 Tax=Rhodopseudomonas palustris (strain BisA53) TaxID=316055 RepID=Q07MW8_RHOP5
MVVYTVSQGSLQSHGVPSLQHVTGLSRSTCLLGTHMTVKRPPSKSDQLPLPVGASVVASRDFGPIRKGVFGMITGTAREPFFQGNRPVYLCTFADNMKSLVRPREIESYSHGFSLDDLEAENFQEVVARRGAAKEAAPPE